MDFRLFNGNPKATLIEDLAGRAIVIVRKSEGLKREEFPSRVDALEWIHENGYEISASFLGGPSGMHKRGCQK